MPTLFYLLFFFVPLILWPFTSELFEFNKMVLVYILTLFICTSWAVEMIKEKKIIFRRTILDIPLLIFLGSQLLSTILSIDPRTSFLGYYSRFHGGLLSSFSYALLYWAYVSNMDQKKTLSAVRCSLFAAVLVCIYGILEHFGIDKNLWVQDVQNRIFSTLGQPNWLAAYLVALIPMTWSNSISKSQIPKTTSYTLSVLFFITLLFTKSRSGILGFAVADVLFWLWVLIRQKNLLKQFFIFHFSFLVLAGTIGTPWTPPISKIFAHNQPVEISEHTPAGPALETGGTESGVIRKIVWKGAINIWKHNLLLGTGPETFAYSYYMYRPIEHNLVSEWDFIYNKAHNEYLNFMATTGTLGILSYTILILFSIVQISKIIPSSKLAIALITGYVSILVTNFFGFSVVPVALEFFLFPAMAVSLKQESERVEEHKSRKMSSIQKATLLLLYSVTLLLLCSVARYWYSDIFYNRAKQYNSAGKYPEALSFLQQAVKLSPNEALYRNELSQTSASLAVAFFDLKKEEESQKFTDFAVVQSDKAVSLSPANINILRNRANLFYKLSKVNPEYLKNAIETLLTASAKAPTDAKIFYNLGIMYLRVGQIDTALQVLEKTILLKSNYKEARLAYALTLVDAGKPKEAKEQLTYILEKIDPNDKTAKEELKKIK